MTNWTDVAAEAPEIAELARSRIEATGLGEANGNAPPPGPFHLFAADITEVVTIKPAGDHLDIDTWKVGRGTTHVDRY